MRHLATIRTIADIQPIEGKDRIVLAIVDGWQVIVRKDEYTIGDQTVFIEPDAILPEREEFEFLRPKKFRIKTMKMGGVLSQGICFPLSVLPGEPGSYHTGDDVTEVLGVRKYEPYEEEPVPVAPRKRLNPVLDMMLRIPVLRPLARRLAKSKKVKMGWPEFIAKTDETRIQNVPFVLKRKDLLWEVHEKVDGQSGTFFLRKLPKLFPWSRQKFDFGVCSRNQRRNTPDDTTYWHVARKYRIEEVLRQLIGDREFVAIQGECIGPKVQGNKYQVSEPDLYCFNLIYPEGKVDSIEAEQIVGKYGLKWVPLLEAQFTLPDTVEEMLEYATGKSMLHDTMREGVVIRNYRAHLSFKAVSPDFLIKWDE